MRSQIQRVPRCCYGTQPQKLPGGEEAILPAVCAVDEGALPGHGSMETKADQMHHVRSLASLLGVFALLTACSGEGDTAGVHNTPDAASPDVTVPPDAGGDAVADVDSGTEIPDAEPDSQPDGPDVNHRRAFIAIHLEAHPTPNLAYQDDHWSTLVDLVEAADAHDARLTLEFNPQWGMYLLGSENAAKLQALRAMIPRHEVGLHHHGPSHPDWNGFTNDPAYIGDPRYQGSIQEMMGTFLVPLVAGSAQEMVLTAGATNEDTDWPPLIPIDTDGGAAPSDLLTEPPFPQVTHGATTVRQLRYRQYATGDPNAATLQEVESRYGELDDGAVMGLVFHCQDFRHRPGEIQALFASLRDNEVEVLPVQEIVEAD